MRKVLVFQHVSSEPLGVLDRQLREHGCRIKFVNFSREPGAQPDVSRYNGLIVLGGPMNTDAIDRYPNLLTEMEAIREAISRGLPVLGICLGAQLIAEALGARVGRNAVKEIGWYAVTPTAEGRKDPLFAHFDGTERIFQWHGDSFELPAGATLLASSERCENQAFRFGDNVYALQFHLEVDTQLIERWIVNPNMCAELGEIAQQGLPSTPEAVRKLTARYIDRSLALAHDFFGEFIHRFHHRRRRIRLPSR